MLNCHWGKCTIAVCYQMTHTNLFFYILLTNMIILRVWTNLEDFFHVAVAPFNGLSAWFVILLLHIFWAGVISTPGMRDLYQDQKINWRFPAKGAVIAKHAVIPPAYPVVQSKSHLRLLICNTPPTSWIRDGVGQERVLMPFDRSNVSTFNPYHCFSQCSPPSAPRRQEPYVGWQRSHHRVPTLAIGLAAVDGHDGPCWASPRAIPSLQSRGQLEAKPRVATNQSRQPWRQQ